MTMNSERQLEPTVLLSAILIKSAVLCGSPGNEKKSVCARVCVCVCVCLCLLFLFYPSTVVVLIYVFLCVQCSVLS